MFPEYYRVILFYLRMVSYNMRPIFCNIRVVDRNVLVFDGDCSSVGRAPDCDSGRRGFESHHPPHFSTAYAIRRRQTGR